MHLLSQFLKKLKFAKNSPEVRYFLVTGCKLYLVKAIGGSGVKNTSQAYFEVLFTTNSTLFTELKNSYPFRSYDLSKFRKAVP